MGVLPAKEKMPSSKFVFPKNGATIGVNQTFTIQMRIKDLETGNFVNAAQNFYAAPQQLNGQGIIRGHSHVVIQQIPALDSTDLLNPEAFVFFKGLNSAGNSAGILAVEVTNGLPAGVYKISSLNTASNHQPALAPVAQHGSLDDTVYVRPIFTCPWNHLMWLLLVHSFQFCTLFRCAVQPAFVTMYRDYIATGARTML